VIEHSPIGTCPGRPGAPCSDAEPRRDFGEGGPMTHMYSSTSSNILDCQLGAMRLLGDLALHYCSEIRSPAPW
jgi:hypothetical protein